MDLPTYTSIWRIEKRLYKLYDFRLPMPVPVGQIAVFAAITVPYVILLTILGLPFNHSLFWLYVLPPGVITWLATRPVLESKRLPELVISQVRYLGEPGTWARMAPLAEKDDVVVIGKVWRRDEEGSRTPAEAPALAPAAARRPAPARVRQAARKPAARKAATGQPAQATAATRPPAGPGAECCSSAATAPQGPARPSCSVAGDRWPRGASARRGERTGASRDCPRRTAGPAPPGGRASGPPCGPAWIPGRCAGDGHQERGRHHPARASRGCARGPPGRRVMAGEGPAHPGLAGERDAGRASLGPAGSPSPGPSGPRGSGDSRGTRRIRRSTSRPGRGRPSAGGRRPGAGRG